MKKLTTLIISFLFIFIAMLITKNSECQEYKETITKEFKFKNAEAQNELNIRNITGSINVEGYDGDVVLIEVEKIIDARNIEDLEKMKRDIHLKFIEEGNKISARIESPFTKKNGKFSVCKLLSKKTEGSYNFKFNYKVKIPHNTNLWIKNIADGHIVISDVSGKVRAKCIEGDIYLKETSGKTKIKTIEGDITARYAKNPDSRSTYKTISGDIRVGYMPDLSAKIKYSTICW